MDEKKLIRLGGKIARGLIDLLQEELTGEKRKKKKEKKNAKRKRLSSATGSVDSSS